MLRGTLVLVTIWLVALTLGATAHETRHKTVSIVHPFVVETVQSQVYLQARIKNMGHATERLLRVSTPLAAKVSIVDATGKDLNQLTIPGGEELTLKSDGARILLTGLAKPLRAYDSFDLTLVFQKAGAVTVEVIVEEKTSDEASAG